MPSSRRGTTNEARNVVGYLCRRLSGQTPARIGKEFHLDNGAGVSSVATRMKKTLTQDVSLRKRVDSVERQLRKAYSSCQKFCPNGASAFQ